MLFFEFRSEIVHLDQISDRWLGMKPKYAREKFNRGELPLPAFRLTDSQGAPLVCTVKDLATYIDRRAAKAKAEWIKSRI